MTDEAEAPEKGGDGCRSSIRSEMEQGRSRAGNVWKARAFRPGATQAARRGPKKRSLKMKRLMIAVVGVVAVLLLAAGGASAGTTYTIEHSHSQGVGSANISFNGGTSTQSAYLGRFIMEPKPITELPAIYPIYSISTVDGPEMGFFSYCLEPLQSIGVGHGTAFQYEFSIGSLVGTDAIDAGDAALIRELFGRYNSLLQNNPTGPYTGGTFRTAAAALQLAMWKINLDRTTETLGSWDFASGWMRVNSANVPQETIAASIKADAVALLMLNSLTGTGPMASGLQGLANPTIQDLIIQPEPATMALLALGGVGLLVRRSRGKK
jgi:hypothetical protein